MMAPAPVGAICSLPAEAAREDGRLDELVDQVTDRTVGACDDVCRCLDATLVLLSVDQRLGCVADIESLTARRRNRSSFALEPAHPALNPG